MNLDFLIEKAKKLRDDRAAAVQAANAQLAPIEAQMRELVEQKAVLIGNANIVIGKIDGELNLIEEITKNEKKSAEPPKPPALAAVPPVEDDDTTPAPAAV